MIKGAMPILKLPDLRTSGANQPQTIDKVALLRLETTNNRCSSSSLKRLNKSYHSN